MAVLKCKMCGGDLHFEEGASICECEYCGNTNTLPVVSSDQEMNLFNRANHFRMINEFDKAISAYERILDTDDTNAEAHWGIVLSRYGIEYVEDPVSHERIPTCHRVQLTSILSDPDYLAAVEHADSIASAEYKVQAEKIAQIQKGILAISSQEKPYDVFICYKESDDNGNRTVDSTLAQDIYYGLTESGYRVFFSRITLEDKLGQEYEPYIFAALNSAKVMVVVGTKPEYFNAVWVKNEWSRYLALMKNDRHRLLIPCYRDMDPYDLPDELSMLQSQDMGKIGFMQDLLRGMNKVLANETKKSVQQETVAMQPGAIGTTANAQVLRGNMALEDQEWSKADVFFEEALNLDPKCAEAYIGKLLGEKKQRNWDALVGAWVKQYEKQTTERLIACSEEKEHIEEIVDKYMLTGYLEKDTIRKLYEYEFGYDSALLCRKQQKELLLSGIDGERLLKRARQYAKGETAIKIEDGLAKVTEILNQRIAKAQKEDKESVERVKEKYAVHIEQADRKAAKLYQEACDKQDKDYCKAAEAVRAADTISSYEQALNQLNVVGDYKDSPALASQCLHEIARLQEEKHKEEERQVEIRRQEQVRAEKKKKTITGLLLGVAIACAAGFFIVTKVVIPNNNYQAAIALKESGNYNAAITAFEALDGYKDSSEQIEACETAIKDNDYDAAVVLMENGDYESAITAFKALDGYKDSSEQIEACETVIKDNDYDAAVALMESGDYNAAITTFEALDGYKDSSEQIEACETAIKDNDYDAAIALMENGEYEAAITAFKALDGHKDSKEKIKVCKTAIKDHDYEEALSLMDSEDYEDAIEAFKVLDGYKDSASKIVACKIKIIERIDIGNTVFWGAYEQDNDTSNGKEDIEWIVLDKDNSAILLISKYVLDCQQFNTVYGNGSSWDSCSLKKWLNKTFVEDAFTSEEIEKINKTFLLSTEEVEKYFDTKSERTCEATAYANAQGADAKRRNSKYRENCWWWLRSRGKYGDEVFYDSTAIVLDDGTVDTFGDGVIDKIGVRPALWIKQ